MFLLLTDFVFPKDFLESFFDNMVQTHARQFYAGKGPNKTLFQNVPEPYLFAIGLE